MSAGVGDPPLVRVPVGSRSDPLSEVAGDLFDDFLGDSSSDFERPSKRSKADPKQLVDALLADIDSDEDAVFEIRRIDTDDIKQALDISVIREKPRVDSSDYASAESFYEKNPPKPRLPPRVSTLDLEPTTADPLTAPMPHRGTLVPESDVEDDDDEEYDELDIDSIADSIMSEVIDLDKIAKTHRSTHTMDDFLRGKTIHSLFKVKRTGILKISFDSLVGRAGSKSGRAEAKHTTIPVNETTTVGDVLDKIHSKRDLADDEQIEMYIDGYAQARDVLLDIFLRGAGASVKHTFEIRMKPKTKAKSERRRHSDSGAISQDSKPSSFWFSRRRAKKLAVGKPKTPMGFEASATSASMFDVIAASRKPLTRKSAAAASTHSTSAFSASKKTGSSKMASSGLGSLDLLSSKVVADELMAEEYRETELKHRIERVLGALPELAYRVLKVFTLVNQTRILRIRKLGIENVIPTKVFAASSAALVQSTKDAVRRRGTSAVESAATGGSLRQSAVSKVMRSALSEALATAPLSTATPDPLLVRRRGRKSRTSRKRARTVAMLSERAGKVTAFNSWAQIRKVYLLNATRLHLKIVDDRHTTTRIYESEFAGRIYDEIQKRLELIRRMREESRREDLSLRFQKELLQKQILFARTFEVGDCVRLTGNRLGVVEWIGAVQFAPGKHYMVKLTRVEAVKSKTPPPAKGSPMPVITESLSIEVSADEVSAESTPTLRPLASTSTSIKRDTGTSIVLEATTESKASFGRDRRKVVLEATDACCERHPKHASHSGHCVGDVVTVSASQLVRKVQKQKIGGGGVGVAATSGRRKRRAVRKERSSVEEEIFSEVRHMILSSNNSAGRSRADFQKKLTKYTSSDSILDTVRQFMNALCEFIHRKFGEEYARRLKIMHRKAESKRQRCVEEMALGSKSVPLGRGRAAPSRKPAATTESGTQSYVDEFESDSKSSSSASSTSSSSDELEIERDYDSFTEEATAEVLHLDSSASGEESSDDSEAERERAAKESHKWAQLQLMVQINDRVTAVIESAVETTVLTPNLELLKRCCERYTSNSEEHISAQLCKLYDKSQAFFGIPEAIRHSNEWGIAVYELTLIRDKSLPSEMVGALVNTAKAVFECHKQESDTRKASAKQTFIAGDDMLPILIFVYVTASQLLGAPVFTDVHLMLMNGLISPGSQKSEPGYYLAVFHAAVEWVTAYS